MPRPVGELVASRRQFYETLSMPVSNPTLLKAASIVTYGPFTTARRAFFESLPREVNDTSILTQALQQVRLNADFATLRGWEYRDILRVAEALSPSEWSQRTARIVKEHNLYMLLITRRRANLQRLSPKADPLHRATLLMDDLTQRIHLAHIWGAGNPARCVKNTFCPIFCDQVRKVAQLLRNQVIVGMTRLGPLYEPQWEEIVENVGPNVKVEDISTAVRDSTAMSLCPICQDDHTSEDPFIRLNACQQCLVGKSCLESWVNSMQTTSNQCPLCRNVLFPSRRRIVRLIDTGVAAWHREWDRMGKITKLINSLDKDVRFVYGPAIAEHIFHGHIRYIKDAVARLRLDWDVRIERQPSTENFFFYLDYLRAIDSDDSDYSSDSDGETLILSDTDDMDGSDDSAVV